MKNNYQLLSKLYFLLWWRFTKVSGWVFRLISCVVHFFLLDWDICKNWTRTNMTNTILTSLECRNWPALLALGSAGAVGGANTFGGNLLVRLANRSSTRCRWKYELGSSRFFGLDFSFFSTKWNLKGDYLSAVRYRNKEWISMRTWVFLVLELPRVAFRRIVLDVRLSLSKGWLKTVHSIHL